MEYKYIVVENKYDNGIASRKSFGIAYVEIYDNITIVITSISDITSDRIAIEKFARLCNELQLSIIHLQDVIEDFLIENQKFPIDNSAGNF